MTLHVASLFTGVGGIDLAFERAGAPARLMCEYDKAARGVLARRFPDVPIHPDVQELTADLAGVHTETVVRRLTPLECERLQGAPDGWTDGQADSPRYRQLGNAVAVPVFEWVARRLVAIDARRLSQGVLDFGDAS